jgi:hypothetical protein
MALKGRIAGKTTMLGALRKAFEAGTRYGQNIGDTQPPDYDEWFEQFRVELLAECNLPPTMELTIVDEPLVQGYWG